MKEKKMYKIKINPETEEFEHTVEKSNTFSYKLTEFDKEGWANADKHKPIPFELVKVLTHENKEKNAWWSLVKNKGTKTTEEDWKGVRLKPTDRIIKWKRRRYEWIQ